MTTIDYNIDPKDLKGLFAATRFAYPNITFEDLKNLSLRNQKSIQTSLDYMIALERKDKENVNE